MHINSRLNERELAALHKRRGCTTESVQRNEGDVVNSEWTARVWPDIATATNKSPQHRVPFRVLIGERTARREA